MKYNDRLNGEDQHIISNKLNGFIPEKIFDIHGHLYHPDHYAKDAFSFLKECGTLGWHEYNHAMARTMGNKNFHGLFFGMPHKSGDRQSINEWINQEVQSGKDTISKALKLVSPEDDKHQIASELRNGTFCGLKVYHIYANRPDTMHASITEYAPEWMWEILNETQGVMMLHIVRKGGIADEDNLKEIRRLCLSYPRMKLILAHIARSFNYRNARTGLKQLSDLDNVVVDTSAICETETFRAAYHALGPKRILWGSDFPVSEMRGRCVTTGDHFYWLHPEVLVPDFIPPAGMDMTLVGIESLLAMKEVCDDCGLTTEDIQDIFHDNALHLLSPHLPAHAPEDKKPQGPELWNKARTLIAGGTGLLSKRAEMFDKDAWPSYYSRCSGCEVWDLNGKRYIDFVGGVGAILLGYSDPDVNAAVNRRVALGTYCSLINPQEISLAEKLLALHPWAGKVRFARTGGEAMAIAIRCARTATGKSGVAFCGYHGWHDWYLAANLGETTALDGHLLPGLDPKGVPRELSGTSLPFRYNDIASFDKAWEQLQGNLAAVVMEPMRSQQPKPEFIEHISTKCSTSGVVLIVDEITSGLRYGFPGAHLQIGLQPDMVVYAKAMSNGYPFGAIIGRDEVMRKSEDSFISSSYWTDGVGTAAALAVLEKVQALNVQEVIWDRGLKFQQSLRDVVSRYPACKLEVGGMPSTPTLTFHLGEDAQAAKSLYIRKMLEKGFLVSTFFYLMYAHEDRHIASLLAALDYVLADLEKIIAENRLHTGTHNNSNNHSGFARLT